MAEDGRIVCDLCPRLCALRDGQRGMCFVRMREGDHLVLDTYGRSSGFCIDPIEKKPLNHFLPGTPVLSFGTAGSVVNRRAIIRGMSQQTRVGDETNVATFIDGVYTPGFSGAEFFVSDSLERIEVLKGPQSALYGRNSFAGAINYVTAKPDYELAYGGQTTVGQDDRRGISGYLSGPVIDDTLALHFR